MINLNEKAIAYMSLLGFIFVICLPMTIYCWTTIFRDRHKIYMVKRRPVLVFLALFGINICQFVYLPSFSLEILMYGRSTSLTDYYALVFLWCPSMYIFLTIATTRFWLLYFDTNISKLNLNRVWLCVIDDTVEASNWFKNHENTFGNSKLLTFFCLVLVILLTAVAATLRGIFSLEFVSRIVDITFIFIIAITTIIIWYKLKDCQHDLLGIRHEILSMFILGFITLIVNTICALLYDINSIPRDLYDIVWCIVSCAGISALNIVETIYPRKLSEMQHNNNNNNNNSKQNQILNKIGCTNLNCALIGDIFPCLKLGPNAVTVLKMENTATASSVENTPSANPIHHNCNNTPSLSAVAALALPNVSLPSSKTGSRTNLGYTRHEFGSSWSDIVCTPFGYESLMNHLSKEFAVENLLFISEYVQLKNRLQKCFGPIMNDILTKNHGVKYTLKLPNYDDTNKSKGIPMSTIVKNMSEKLKKLIADRNSFEDENNDTDDHDDRDRERDHGPSISQQNSKLNIGSASPPSHPVPIKKKSSHSILATLKLGARSPSYDPSDSGNDSDNDNHNNRNSNNNNHSINIIQRTNSNQMSIQTALKVDIHSIQIGKIVISAFNNLFDKYISSASQFSINVKSETRNTLTSMFDETFFALWSANRDLDSKVKITSQDGKKERRESIILQHKKAPSKNEISLWHRLKHESSSLGSISEVKQQMKFRNIKKEKKNFIIVQFDKYAEAHGHSIKEADLLEWLITKLLITMEPAVTEIAVLMNDSYSRFKRSDTKIFSKSVQLAKKPKRIEKLGLGQ